MRTPILCHVAAALKKVSPSDLYSSTADEGRLPSSIRPGFLIGIKVEPEGAVAPLHKSEIALSRFQRMAN
jgi:hypothetical protein